MCISSKSWARMLWQRGHSQFFAGGFFMKIHARLALVAVLACTAGAAWAQGAIRPGKIRVAAAPSSAAALDTAPAPLAAPSVAAAAAGDVYTGIIPCDLGADVTIAVDEQNAGFFHVKAGNKNYHMRPVSSRTGATRLEDTDAGAMWLQLGNKSMLLDQKAGRRIADGCAAPAQVEFAAQMQQQPAVNLLNLGN